MQDGKLNQAMDQNRVSDQNRVGDQNQSGIQNEAVNRNQSGYHDRILDQAVDTSELESRLNRSPSLDAFLEDNQDSFVDSDFISMFSRIFSTKAISKAALAKRSATSDVYLHQLFSGRRKPSRNRLLCLCIGMNATLEECQELLRRNKNATLYPRSRRDAVIEYGILHHMNIYEINDRLYREDEETLF